MIQQLIINYNCAIWLSTPVLSDILVWSGHDEEKEKVGGGEAEARVEEDHGPRPTRQHQPGQRRRTHPPEVGALKIFAVGKNIFRFL